MAKWLEQQIVKAAGNDSNQAYNTENPKSGMGLLSIVSTSCNCKISYKTIQSFGWVCLYVVCWCYPGACAGERTMVNIPAGQPQVARPLSGYMLSEVSTSLQFPREKTMARNRPGFDTSWAQPRYVFFKVKWKFRGAVGFSV